MSKISYSSLEEVWGNSFNNNNTNNIKNNNNKKVHINSNNLNNISDNNISDNNIYDNNIYDNNISSNNINHKELNISKLEENKKLLENDKRQNEQSMKVLKDMNNVERNKIPENNINDDYNKYRFNSVNTVNSLYENNKEYSPFKDDLDKKYLQDKLIQLENDFRKYKIMINTDNDTVESFSNHEEVDNSNNELLDLIVLIIIGLIIIFVMDSVFKIGKIIGARGVNLNLS